MKVILLMAITLDGKIGRDADHFPDWTGRADKKRFVEITKKAGVLIMGSRTFDTIGKPLPGRKNVVMTRNRDRVSHQEDLVFTDTPPDRLIRELAAEGYAEAILAGGAVINSLFARAGLIDEVAVTLSPLIFGTGPALFSDEIALDLELLHVERIDSDRVFLRYRVLNRSQT